MNPIPVLVTMAALGASLASQSLVKDIDPNATSPSSGTHNLVQSGGLVYFQADDGIHGMELWRSDGTAAGTALVKDIQPVPGQGAQILYLTAYAGGVVFAANDGTHGSELWKSDGTPGGTAMVADILPGPGDSMGFVSAIGVLGSKIFFGANDGVTGMELWSYDGSAVSFVKDVYPGAGHGYPTRFAAAGSKLFFMAYAGFNSPTLFVTDGTSAGTLNLDPTLLLRNPSNLVGFGNLVIFLGSANGNDVEPWISDGTIAGTMQLADINTGPLNQSSQISFTVVGSRCFFAATSPNEGKELWITDGTPAGTHIVVDFNPGPASGVNPALAPLGNGVLLTLTTAATGLELGFSDGTAAGTRVVKDITPGPTGTAIGQFGTVGTSVYFTATTAAGSEPWITDGTNAGTRMVKDINPGTGGSGPTEFTALGNVALFSAADPNLGFELFMTDGTVNGTHLVYDVNQANAVRASGSPGWLTRVGSRVVMAATEAQTGTELWVSDGTTAGTSLLMDIDPGVSSSDPNSFTTLGDKVIFIARSASTGTELWVTDGTLAGTHVLKDIYPGTGSSSPTQFAVSGGKLFFSAIGSTIGAELWVTDGTNAGTQLVMDIEGGGGDGFPNFGQTVITPFGNGVLFLGYRAGSFWLYSSDGTFAGTQQVKFLNRSQLKQLFSYSSFALFVLGGGGAPDDLWVTDGTSAGTHAVVTTTPGFLGKTMVNFKSFQGKAFFTTQSPTLSSAEALYASDGTAAGTSVIADLSSTTGRFVLNSFTLANDTLFFLADNAGSGRELWASDGTTAGTRRVVDLAPGPANGSSGIAPWAIGDGRRVVAALSNGAFGTGMELWMSDGTAAGTTLAFDVNPGTADGNPGNYCILGDVLLFAAESAAVGRELWSIPLALLQVSESRSFGSRCSVSATPTIRSSGGPAAIGNAAFAVTLEQSQATAPCALLLASTLGNLPIGACTVYPDLATAVSLPMLTSGTGAASQVLPLPTNTSWVGLQLYFQWATAETGGPVLGVVNVSDGLRIRIGGS